MKFVVVVAAVFVVVIVGAVVLVVHHSVKTFHDLLRHIYIDGSRAVVV